MAKLVEIVPVKTYATRENAVKAVEKLLPETSTLRYFIHTTKDGRRYFPVFIGAEALQHGIQFHFNVIG